MIMAAHEPFDEIRKDDKSIKHGSRYELWYY